MSGLLPALLGDTEATTRDAARAAGEEARAQAQAMVRELAPWIALGIIFACFANGVIGQAGRSAWVKLGGTIR